MLWVTAVSWGAIVTTVGVGVPRGSLSPPYSIPLLNELNRTAYHGRWERIMVTRSVG